MLHFVERYEGFKYTMFYAMERNLQVLISIYIYILHIIHIYNVIEGVRCTLQKVMELTQMLLCSHF